MGKTKYLVATFLATALLTGGCSDSENVKENPAPNSTSQTQNLAGQRLTDDSGVEYTLIDNGDGTETARYDDGRSVTFRRQEDGSLDYLYGVAGLMAGMAAGYYLFHGFSRPAGTWNPATNRYTVSKPLRREEKNTAAGGTSARPSSSASSSTPNTSANSSTAANSNSKVNLSKEGTPSSSASSSNSKVNLSKESSSSSSAKSGFGGAGARSSAAS